jgi:hypothetical protein
MNRFLQASSNPGDVVLDPFCGCGTMIDAAEKPGTRGTRPSEAQFSLVRIIVEP